MLLLSLSDVQPVKNPSLNTNRPDSITYYRCLSSQSWAGAGGCGLTERQPSAAFYHLCHTGISATRVPDLDTSLAISGSKTLAACHTEQDRRQNAHPAARTTAGASLPTHPVVSLCLLAAHSMHKVTPLQLSRLNVTLSTETGFSRPAFARRSQNTHAERSFLLFLLSCGVKNTNCHIVNNELRGGGASNI